MAQSNRRIRIQFRLLASIPPILLGLWIRELGVITDYAGTTGFMIGLTVPGLLYIQSRRRCEEANRLWHGTYYSSFASSYWMASGLAAIGMLLMGYVLKNLVLQE